MKYKTGIDCLLAKPRWASTGFTRTLWGSVLSMALICLLSTPVAAANEVVDYFGTKSGFGSLGGEFRSPKAVAVNQTGAGPADIGDIYVVDQGSFPLPNRHHRIQHFGRDDGGTPLDPFDDTFHFISAWGADVDATPSGGADYEICTVASDCKTGVASGGNGTSAGNGSLNFPRGIVVDQDTGNVYVTDDGNHRINVYEGDGTFLRSFGFDVVSSGPGQLPAPNEQQTLTVTASSGRFSLFFAGDSTGGKGTGNTIQGTKLVTSLNVTSGAFAVGQAFSASAPGIPSIFPVGTTITAIGTKSLTLSEPATSSLASNSAALVGDNLTYNSTAEELKEALMNLPSIGGVGGTVAVTGGPGDATGSSPYVIEFGGTLSGDDVSQIDPSAGGLIAGSAIVHTVTQGGAFEVCTANSGDICRGAAPGKAIGQLGPQPSNSSSPIDITVSPSDGNPASGKVYVADSPNRRINVYDIDGSNPSSVGSPTTFAPNHPEKITVDSRGILYASDNDNNGEIERYDTLDANGNGSVFLKPLKAPIGEVQQVTVNATAGEFQLAFDPDGVGPLPPEVTSSLSFDATALEVRTALRDLPSIGALNLTVVGGNGEVSGKSPYTISFRGSFIGQDVSQLTASDGGLSGGSGVDVVTLTQGHGGPLGTGKTMGLTVDLDSDGGGPETDVLYVMRDGDPGTQIQQYGPVNQAGLDDPPSALDAMHGLTANFGGTGGIAIDEATGRLYVTATTGAGSTGHGIYVLGSLPLPQTVSLDSITEETATTARVNGTVNPNGPSDVSFHVEYSQDGSKWTSTPKVLVGSQMDPQQVSFVLDPLPSGLQPNTSYQVRLVASRPLFADATSSELSFKTLTAPPSVETVGAPIRSANMVQLGARVLPNNSTGSYWFQFGTEGPCSANPCQSTVAKPIDAGTVTRLVSEQLTGLSPATTYYYRVLADNGSDGSPVFGKDLSVTTHVSDAALTHGEKPGPPGSDRAYEQVNLPNTGGNIVLARGLSDDGDRALYTTAANPLSVTGAGGIYFAERTAGSWQTKVLDPKREDLVGSDWTNLVAREDLEELVVENRGQGEGREAVWRLSSSLSPVRLFEFTGAQQAPLGRSLLVSADTARVVALRQGGTLDPDYPGAASQSNLYELGGSEPTIASLLPGGSAASCGVQEGAGFFGFAGGVSARSLSQDGRYLYFPSKGNDCSGPIQFYARNLQTDETEAVTRPPVSGPACSAAIIRSTPGAAFFWTQTRFDPADTEPVSCSASDTPSDGDIYRFDAETKALKCVSCIASVDADVSISVGGSPANSILVSNSGSRLYFRSGVSLLPGTLPGDMYRLKLDSEDLTHIGSLAGVAAGSMDATSDGAVLAFRSSDPSLNPLGGTENAGTTQYYRYNDNDRSLICASCPVSGAPPAGDVAAFDGVAGASAISATGDLAFSSPTPLVQVDQNTTGVGQSSGGGSDIYEWRQGRHLLITDGLSDWAPDAEPRLAGISPSGRDLFFTAYAQYTPDAIDSFQRLYDARIGGGFEFSDPPPPCSLEVCQGSPKGTPEDPFPGSATFSGSGNLKKPFTQRTQRKCRKGKRKVRRAGKTRCVKRSKISIRNHGTKR